MGCPIQSWATSFDTDSYLANDITSILESTMSKKIFISHGHNDLAKHKLKDFVRERLSMEPLVLTEQPDLGFTIVEKLEHYGRDCNFALILLTGDDATESGGLRARQNVIHELGYFHGVLGRKRVLLLKEKGVEVFSNISGLIYKEFPVGLIESIFEDVRMAIEVGDLSCRAESVPIEIGDSSGIWDAATTHQVDKIGDRLCADIKDIAKKFSPVTDAMRAIRAFLNSELKDAEEGIASCEQSKPDLRNTTGKDTNKVLADAFTNVAYAVIASDMRRKKRTLVAMLEELDAVSPSDLPIHDVVNKLTLISQIYLKKD